MNRTVVILFLGQTIRSCYLGILPRLRISAEIVIARGTYDAQEYSVSRVYKIIFWREYSS
jgi:hypothetical protein